MKVFNKNDESFVCDNCGKNVKPLNVSSRDHCTNCLCSKHLDINPGDRKNTCMGLLVPIDIEYSANKGYVIVYKCEKCKQLHKNKTANDDKLETILKIMNKTYNHKCYKKINQ